MEIRVGDLVTYKNSMGNIRQVVIKDEEQKIKYINNVKNILKIERPKYEVVEEKRELLTEEEKEFLKYICKYYDVSTIQLGISSICFYTNTDYLIINAIIPEKLQFENIKENKEYTLKELGLEEN